MVHSYSEDISWKMNVIARLEFELAYYDVVVQHVRRGDLQFCSFKVAQLKDIRKEN